MMLNRAVNEIQITHGQRLWLYIFGAVALFLLVAPIMIVFPLSFSDARFLKFPPEVYSLRWYREFFGSDEWMAATWVSFQLAAGACLLATLLGVAASYGIQLLGGRLGRYCEVILLLPLMVPLIITAVGVYFVYAEVGLIATMPGLILSHTMLTVPFVVVTVRSGLKGFDIAQEQAARSLGASRLRAFLDVTLPQIKGSVIAGAIFAFIYALDEVVVAIFISGGENSTLTKRMFTSLRNELDPTIAAISSMLIVISLVIVLLGLLLSNKAPRSRV